MRETANQDLEGLNKHEKTKPFFIGFLVGAIVAAGCSIVGAGIAAGRSADTIVELNRRYLELDREYTERQRELEEQQRGIRDGIAECLGYAENAGAIIERTGENAGRAIGNLLQASELIKQGIAEREALKMELDNLRARLYRLGDLGGVVLE